MFRSRARVPLAFPISTYRPTLRWKEGGTWPDTRPRGRPASPATTACTYFSRRASQQREIANTALSLLIRLEQRSEVGGMRVSSLLRAPRPTRHKRAGARSLRFGVTGAPGDVRRDPAHSENARHPSEKLASEESRASPCTLSGIGYSLTVIWPGPTPA
jgi:hypothetical protein